MKFLAILALTVVTTTAMASDVYRCGLTVSEKDATGDLTFVNDHAEHLSLGSVKGGHLATVRIEGQTEDSSMTLELGGKMTNQNEPQLDVQFFRSVFTRGVGTRNAELCALSVEAQGDSVCEADGFLVEADCKLHDSDSRSYKKLLKKDTKRAKAKVCAVNLDMGKGFSDDDKSLVSSDLRQKNFGIHKKFSNYRNFDLKLEAKSKGFWFLSKCTVTGQLNDPTLSYQSREIKVKKWGKCKRALAKFLKTVQKVETKCKTRDLRGL